jgi:hypothetical protein
VREVIPFLLLVCACGAATWSSGASDMQRRGDGDTRTSRDAMSEQGAPDPRFSSLEARAAAVAPGMRRVIERENAGERAELVRATGRDACVRVLFEATVPVLAKLVDGDGRVLAETQAATAQGTLGEQGPVCVRKGDSVSALLEGTAVARVRWIALGSP